MNTPHKHKDVIIAWAEGKTIQYRMKGANKWLDYATTEISHIFFNNHSIEFRIKPKAKYIPFTFEDREFLRGKWVANKDTGVESMITFIGKNTAFATRYVSYIDLLERFIFLDGSPCGKLVEE